MKIFLIQSLNNCLITDDLLYFQDLSSLLKDLSKIYKFTSTNYLNYNFNINFTILYGMFGPKMLENALLKPLERTEVLCLIRMHVCVYIRDLLENQ